MSNGPLSDIVVRLRMLYDRQRRRNSADWAGHLAQDAIREIEELRASVAELKATIETARGEYRKLKSQLTCEASRVE